MIPNVHHLLCWTIFLIQPPGKTDQSKSPSAEPARPSIGRLWPKLKDATPEQIAQLKKIMEEYAQQIAELEAERDGKLAAVLSKAQRETLAALAAEEVDRYRVVLKARFNRPAQVAKPFKDILGLDLPEVRSRLEGAPGKPVAENLIKSKADALTRALNAAGASATAEKQSHK